MLKLEASLGDLDRFFCTLTMGVACVGVLAGCMEGTAPQPEAKMIDKPGIVVTGADGTRFEGTPMQIHIAEGAQVPAQASITANAIDGRLWSATFGLSLSQLQSGTISLERKPLAAGIGMVGLNDANDALQDFESGTLVFQLANGHTVDGEATTNPVNGSAKFSGKYVAGCWVYPKTLGQSENGHGDGETRIQDVEFTSLFCKQFVDLR